MNILFRVLKEKTNKNGKMPIFCLLTVNGKQKPFSIGCSIKPEHWDKKKQKAKSICEDANIINFRISKILDKFNVLRLKSELEQKKLSVNDVRDFLKGNENKYTFLSAFDNFVKVQEQRKNLGEITEHTFSLWAYRRKNLQLWFKSLDLEDMYLSEIQSNDAEKMKLFFLSIGLNNNYISTMFDDFKRILNYAVSEKLINENPFKNFSVPEYYEEPTFLNCEQLNQLINKDFSNNLFYDKVRDFFIFICFSGLHYKDYINLIENKNMVLGPGVDGRMWINGNRQKGLNQKYGKLTIPLFKGAKNILEKYGTVEKLPKMENQTFNRVLKEIQKIMGFDVVLSCKIGRNTFAHQALNVWNIPIESVAKMLGHEGTDMLKKYARISEHKIANDTKNII